MSHRRATMALNPASHNAGRFLIFHISVYLSGIKCKLAAGIKTGPVTDPPPQASSETTSAILGASKDDPVGQHEGGQSGGEKRAQEKIEDLKGGKFDS